MRESLARNSNGTNGTYPTLFWVLVVVIAGVAGEVIAQPTRVYAPVTDRGDVRPRVLPEQPSQQLLNVQQAPQHVTMNREKESQSLLSPASVSTSLKMLALVTVLGLVPSVVMMTTCFVRFTVVLGLLRQAIGTSQAIPGQVMTALSLFMTLLVMSPVWQRCYDEGIRPYVQQPDGGSVDEVVAFQRTALPLRWFMSRQIDRAGNADAVWMLIDFQRPDPDSAAASSWREPQDYDDVPLTVLLPAYLLSELKVAFLIGFQLFLPFVVIDLVVASILTSMGLTMLPPSLVSLPFKLLLFVLIDGWFLTIGMLLESVRIT